MLEMLTLFYHLLPRGLRERFSNPDQPIRGGLFLKHQHHKSFTA